MQWGLGLPVNTGQLGLGTCFNLPSKGQQKPLIFSQQERGIGMVVGKEGFFRAKGMHKSRLTGLLLNTTNKSLSATELNVCII